MDSLKNPDAEKLSRNGYFWISYEDTSLSDVMVLEVESADNYDNNYYYTNQISDETSDDEFDTVANVFEINGLAGAEKETVSAVGLVTYDTYVDYSIAVYAVDEDGKPDISRKLSKQDTEGTLCFAGIYTIPLNDPVTLSKGDKFAVVVKTGRAGDVAIEYGMEYGDFDIKVYANQGESFCLTGSGWEDYSTYLEDSPEGLVGNFLIQAFTTDEEDPELCNSITGLKCTDRGETSITIEWDGLGDGVKYDIYRAFDSFREEFTLIKSDYNGTVYTDNNLPLQDIFSIFVLKESLTKGESQGGISFRLPKYTE